MKISELEAELARLRVEHGDLETCDDYGFPKDLKLSVFAKYSFHPWSETHLLWVTTGAKR